MTKTNRCITRIPCRAHNLVIMQADTFDPDGNLKNREIMMFTPTTAQVALEDLQLEDDDE